MQATLDPTSNILLLFPMLHAQISITIPLERLSLALCCLYEKLNLWRSLQIKYSNLDPMRERIFWMFGHVRGC